MKKLIKITLIVIVVIFVSLGVIFVSLATIGYFLTDSMESIIAESKEEAVLFAKTASKEQCMEKYIDKLTACGDSDSEISCYSSLPSFGFFCLSEASGSTEEFCSDKPQSQTEFYKGDWKDGLCKSKGLDTSSCLNVYKTIKIHCSK